MAVDKVPAKSEPQPRAALEDASGTYRITMSNALSRAAHGLNLSEKRIVMIAVAKLDSRRHAVGELVKTRITAAEYAETFGLDANTAYEQLKAGAESIYNRSITFYEPAHRRRGKPLAPTRVSMRWTGENKYHQGEGAVEIHWWPGVLPHLTGLREQFTTYQLHQTSALRSIYSWRLFELLMRFKATGWAEYDIEDFAEAMNASDKQREDFAAIRRKIIEPAVRELHDKDGWTIEWRPLKAGRKVVGLRFEFRRNDQLRLELPEPPPATEQSRTPTRADIAALALPGESWEDARERLSKMAPRQVRVTRKPLR